jgi:two-component system chemotaxis response regulator CheY
MRALVVDDSRAMRAILRKILAAHGFEVFEAGTGVEALQELGRIGRPDLALVDWNMPVMNGLELVRFVRADPRYEGLRILMVTTETEMQSMSEALEAGVDEYAMKPFTAEVIAEKLTVLGLRS